MKSIMIQRGPATEEGTFGTLVLGGSILLRTLELPWLNNETGKSCIPAGTYEAVWHISPSKGPCYILLGTAPRTDILIHSANWAGDESKGWTSQLNGCIALGLSTGRLQIPSGKLQAALLQSRQAIKTFHAWANQEPLQIVISEATA